MYFSRIACLIALLFSAVPAFSEERLQPLRTRGELLGWEAIGRLDVKGAGYCSGALIAPDQVLTAAHCVFDTAGRQVAPENILFRAGYVAGEALAERTVSRVIVDAGYQDVPGGKISNKMIRHDVALLRLASPISTSEANPFAIHVDPQEGEKVSVLSYGRGRSEHISWQRDCSVVRRGWGLLKFDCNVTYGSSGAPVFVRYGNRVRILSLVSAGDDLENGSAVSFGMELPSVVAELKRRMRVGDAPVAKVSAGAKRIQIGNRSGTGAKFVRAGGG
ncbi:trypsin-like peptidase domain-containing protein [Shimia sp. R10_1]|uniref:trypsin-like serine peptidase n=1 Tax=Shimia sp. R10_1 TaxID=2821095 RepID=UPI001ADCC31B|nr:trypsin-like peptidase domain-containing protein [Shimia sp. R10_1]MBO9473892.1 trypsin-like peptidase domain-containing protein [Shimia sp. R10_1]